MEGTGYSRIDCRAQATEMNEELNQLRGGPAFFLLFCFLKNGLEA
jgi:hypothetical protein